MYDSEFTYNLSISRHTCNVLCPNVYFSLLSALKHFEYAPNSNNQTTTFNCQCVSTTFLNF